MLYRCSRILEHPGGSQVYLVRFALPPDGYHVIWRPFGLSSKSWFTDMFAVVFELSVMICNCMHAPCIFWAYTDVLWHISGRICMGCNVFLSLTASGPGLVVSDQLLIHPLHLRHVWHILYLTLCLYHHYCPWLLSCWCQILCPVLVSVLVQIICIEL